MEKFPQQTEAIRQALFGWLSSRIDKNAINWLESTAAGLMDEPGDWQLYTSFSTTPRHTGKEMLNLTAAELNEAQKLREGWKPVNWSTDQAGRIFLLLSFAQNGEMEFVDKIEKIFVSSDLGEAVALYQALPVYPYPDKFIERAAEGVRSNMTTVFNAVALNNPYPMQYLDEGPWNQIVLKALFVESPLYKIMGLDKRANPTLAKILIEYAYERWSAGRIVSPELWRVAGPYLTDGSTDDLKRVLENPDEIQKQAGILALKSSKISQKDELLELYKVVLEEIEKSNVTWDEIGERYELADG